MSSSGPLNSSITGTGRLTTSANLPLYIRQSTVELNNGSIQTTGEVFIANGAQQTLSELHIIDRGTIDFSGGNPSTPNRLFLDLLTFNNTSAQLFVCGWHEFEDFLLIKKTAYAVGQ